MANTSSNGSNSNNRRYPPSSDSSQSGDYRRDRDQTDNYSWNTVPTTPPRSAPSSPRPLLPRPRQDLPKVPDNRRNNEADITQISNLSSIRLSNPYLPLASLGSRSPSTSNLIASPPPPSATGSAQVPNNNDDLMSYVSEKVSKIQGQGQPLYVQTDVGRSASSQQSARSGSSKRSAERSGYSPKAPPRNSSSSSNSKSSQQRKRSPTQPKSNPIIPPTDFRTISSTAKIDNVKAQDEPELETTTARKLWLIIVYVLTFYIPDPVLAFLARIGSKLLFRSTPQRRRDQSLATNAALRLAFREKIALCTLIVLLNLLVVFIVMMTEWVLCPETWKYYQSNWVIARREEVRNTKLRGKTLVSRYGYLYKEKNFQDGFKFDVDNSDGNEVGLYPRTNQFTHRRCTEMQNEVIRAIRNETRDLLEVNTRYDPYVNESPVGNVVYNLDEVKSKNDAADRGIWLMINDDIFNLTEIYVGIYPPFFKPETMRLFSQNAGGRIDARALEALDPGATRCLKRVYWIGTTDFRQKLECVLTAHFSTVLLSCVSFLVFFKFLAAVWTTGCRRNNAVFPKYVQTLSTTSTNSSNSSHNSSSSIKQRPILGSSLRGAAPMVILFMPCYTEDRESLSKTLQSLALTDYPDDRKLLWVVCDGLCVGSNNIETTADIVLGLLGFSRQESASGFNMPYVSLAEGPKFINYAQVFSGQYRVPGQQRSVPFILCVKTGDANRQLQAARSVDEYAEKPGNRGKRDSQTILMRFLNKVHYKRRMTPMELEMSYHFYKLLKIDPKEFEYMMMVDADTEVCTNSVREFSRVLYTDKRAMGVCGETMVSNPTDSFVSMSQVFEYYISHSMLKSFESLFGNVTCLPGCFSMWKIVDRKRNLPMLASTDLIYDYGEIHVETLHEKNLLLLGEDRCLTTMMLRCFPGMYTRYSCETACRTTVPNKFSVLASQRRRWINSTVHNMWELLSVPDLCGICIFGMRFIVLLDLLSTLIAPGSFVFLCYIIYQCFASPFPPYAALFVLAGIYFLHGMVAIFQGRFSQLGWLWVHLLAYPLYNFLLPLIAFWQFDNFSWGTTRRIRRARPVRDLDDLEIETPEQIGDNVKQEKLVLEYWNPNDTSWRSKYKSKQPAEAVMKSGSTRGDQRMGERDVSDYIINMSPVSPKSPRKRK